MTQIPTTTNAENDDLTCPITLEPFRDPVRAKDGHVYERDAITRWIFEHGTSPFTREPLQINDLQPDDRLRRLAAQRRNSTVSFNAQNNTVTLPPLRATSRHTARVAPEINWNPAMGNNQLKCTPHRVKIVMIVACILLGIASFAGAVVALQTRSSQSYNSSSSPSQVTSYYSSFLTTNSSVFIRPYLSSGQFYYKSIQMVVSSNGVYNCKSVSTMDMYGCLYRGSFNDQSPSLNLMTCDDDSGGNQQFSIRLSLQSNTYILVATTYSQNVTGTFGIMVAGPGNVNFQ